MIILTDRQEKIIIQKLIEIKNMLGAYNQDQLIHASNVINSNSKNAEQILQIFRSYHIKNRDDKKC